MKSCPKCGQMNENNSDRCYKCGTPLKKITEDYIKKCMKCGLVYSRNADRCERCGERLSVIPITKVSVKEQSDTWAILLAIFFPIVGFILGVVFAAQGRENGTKLIVISIISGIVWAILAGCIIGCYADTHKSYSSYSGYYGRYY